ncbi:unnamed protein product [marine sediment metagenome]|uniref:Uncharacterized protein n=1 Tax=marine sediment metagenome TaxID=412755 RepID=X1FLW7_9ZZZZ
MRGARQQVQHVINLATTPTGPFAAIDQMVTSARSTVRNVGAEVGLRGPGLRGSRLSGQVGTRLRGQVGTRVSEIRGRFPRLRRY